MGKAIKSKKGKVPKITEEEYTAYLASLREGGVCASMAVGKNSK